MIDFRSSFRIVGEGLVLADMFTVTALYTAIAEIKEKGLGGLSFRIMTPGTGQRAASKKQGGPEPRPIFHAKTL